jgi:hypothetical protein
MLGRLVVFYDTHKDLIPKDSEPGRLFDRLEAAAARISAQAAMFVSGTTDVQVSGISRRAARRELLALMTRVCNTAEGMELHEFYLPVGRSDGVLVAAAENLIARAEPLKGKFVERYLPADFIDQLKRHVSDVKSAISGRSKGVGRRTGATTGIRAARVDALNALAALDSIMDNLLIGNEQVKAEWVAARRIPRPTVARKAESPATAETPQPTEKAASTAA